MPWWAWSLVAFAAAVVVWAALVLWLIAAGRRADARALATFIPDCMVLVTRLARDPRVPRRRELLLLGLVGYLPCRPTSSPTSSPSQGSSTTC